MRAFTCSARLSRRLHVRECSHEPNKNVSTLNVNCILAETKYGSFD